MVSRYANDAVGAHHAECTSMDPPGQTGIGLAVYRGFLMYSKTRQ